MPGGVHVARMARVTAVEAELGVFVLYIHLNRPVEEHSKQVSAGVAGKTHVEKPVYLSRQSGTSYLHGPRPHRNGAAACQHCRRGVLDDRHGCS